MSKIYLAKEIVTILDRLDYSRLGQKVGIKVHFGETGCNTYLDPAIARAVYDKLISLGKKPALVECNVLYKGSRVNSTDHICTAREHGFTDMEIDILDGENGGEYIEINGCKIGKGIEKYDSMIILSHFKGHMMAGFGGAIKNVGMGLGSRAGKLFMHSNLKPSISVEKCIGCGVCAAHCNASAITLENGKAKIDQSICEGCAICIAFCNTRAVMIPWGGRTAEDLQDKVAQYAGAVLYRCPQITYINVLQKITEECDCMGITQEPMMPDVGFLYSDDIVAIDKASIDLADKYSEGKFNAINGTDNYKQIEFAKNLGLGSDEYELIEI